jgi:hypothetical protein|tara:strand:+ start:8227 stop:8856 length:630 start_codon:yes stop_codon:yes gene_type:complete
MNDEWSEGSIVLLTKIKRNCITLHRYYRKEHLRFHKKIKWFKLPLIVLNSISATFAVGASGYNVPQHVVNAIICSIGITNGIISAVELQLGIERKAEDSLIAAKDFYILGCDILKVLTLDHTERGCEAILFLNDIYSKYIELIKNNDIINKTIIDELLVISLSSKSIKLPSTPNSGISISTDGFGLKDEIELENMKDSLGIDLDALNGE